MSDPVTLHPPPAPSSAPVPTAFDRWAWVPIRSLAARHRPRIAAHLTALDEHDRYLRFGYPAADEQIARYVDALDFERDELFGIFNRRLELIAMAHLANSPAPGPDNPRAMAEFGVSVLALARGRGYGGRLFEHAVLHARNRGVQTLFIHALSENTAMLRIARKAGALVERDGPETEAWLKLPPDSLATRVGELMEQQAADFDYRLKVQARRVNDILEAISEVKANIGGKTPIASE
ncbi:GNAT family N-acetyltransferase [Piscinibacter sp.]|uniref:GNAT family N-acetyltransferase n=1 Tax=Piscinibacter sp. TaxID=1903157 RepID=UPI002C6A9AB6|nr:GNAT family N-acetyltransferase [Albitalea sp.]HUG22674.1 GNAT family N-acetyltransferase [Albitalea sp.]